MAAAVIMASLRRQRNHRPLSIKRSSGMAARNSGVSSYRYKLAGGGNHAIALMA